MSVLSRSVTAAQRGRSFAGAPVFDADERPGMEGSTCRCSSTGRGPGTVTVLYPADRPGGQGSVPHREAGMATAEYAIATLAAVAFAALLVAVLGSGEVRSLLMGLIRSALTLG